MRTLLVAIIVAGGLAQHGAGAAETTQTSPTPTVADVRGSVAAARKEMDAYKAAGGTAGAANHPAVKWDAALWAYREQSPRTDAAALAAAEAIYEIRHLSIGLQAPAISGTLRNTGRAITLESFRGKPIVIVFWGST